MTQHPSLKSGLKGSIFRSVLKRFEKIKELADKEKWDEKKNSIYHLPKVKRIKFKIKKVKGPVEEGAEGAVPGASTVSVGGKDTASKEAPKGAASTEGKAKK